MNRFLLLFASLLFLTGTSINFYQKQRFIEKSVLTIGVVKGYEEKTGIHQIVQYYPVIEFDDDKNIKQEFISDLSLSIRAYQSGDSISVYYQSEAPQKARIRQFATHWGDIIGGFTIGVLLLLYCGVTFIYGIWNKFMVKHASQNLRNKAFKYEIKVHTL